MFGLVMQQTLVRYNNFYVDGRAVFRFGIHKQDFQATKVRFFGMLLIIKKWGIPHEYAGIKHIPDYIMSAVESVMQFLRPVFERVQLVYQTYAPILFATVQKKIEEFFSSMLLLFVLVYFFRVGTFTLPVHSI